jgi:cyclopropane-fatty-acyl-phospholipid synthase
MSIFSNIGRRAVHSRLERLTEGRLTLRWDGDVTVFGSGDGPAATVTVHDPGFFVAMALGGHLGAAESYVEGGWDVDDATALVRLFLRNREALDGLETGLARLAQPVRALLHGLNRNTRLGSKGNISRHYDLGNELFAQFLDDTMTYSCGIFETADSSMRDASIEKYDRICRKLELTPADHVLEIGTGWGGFALHAASTYGCRVTTTTISEEQHVLATQRVAAARLTERITVLHRDYRDLEGTYDKLVSIEMIEAVGHQYFGTYFEQCSKLLKPHGKAAIQAITIQDRYYESARREVDFIKRYIFPGSCIPAVSVLATAAAATDLRLVHLEDITPHYAETLRRWPERCGRNWPEISALGYDERFKRLWSFYFSYCEAGFDEAVLGDVQLLFAKPKASAVRPLAREGTPSMIPSEGRRVMTASTVDRS